MINYIFIQPGISAKPENDKIIFPSNSEIGNFSIGSTFLCDVGNHIGLGIIDHHTLDKENECATTLVHSEQVDLIDKVLLPSPTYTIITHFEPDFDAIGSTYFVTKKISQTKISPSFETLANYILDVDLGKIQLDENSVITPFSLILAIAHIINNKYEPLMKNKSKEEYFQLRQDKSKEILLRSHKLLDYVLSKLDDGFGIYDTTLFADSTEFSEEINLLQDDYKIYLSDFKKSETYSIPLINKNTHLLEPVDFIITDVPCSILWKYWVRGDRKHSKNGFSFTCAFLDTYKQNHRNRAIIAVDRTTNFSLKGLGIALEEAELEKLIIEESTKPIKDPDILTIIENEKTIIKDEKIKSEILDDTQYKYRTKSETELYTIINTTPEKIIPNLGLGIKEKRNEYHRANPWFDERDDFTIIDSPREGSILDKNNIKQIILAYRYWQSLAKTSLDENGNIFCDINLLYPTLLIKRFYNLSKFEHLHHTTDEAFITSLKQGIFVNEEFNSEMKKHRLYLLSPNSSNPIECFSTFYKFVYNVSKIPIKTNYFQKQISFVFSEILSLCKEILIKSSINKEYNVQSETLKLLYVFYTPDVMQSILQEFKILSSQDFIKYFLYATEKKDSNEILHFSFYLLSKNDPSIFAELVETTNNSANQKSKLLCPVFTISSHLKEISNIKYSEHTYPISSFDDWKDTIDDYLVFRCIKSQDHTLIKNFIRKDSSFFLSPNLNIDEYNKFVLDFNKIKTELLFHNKFWKDFLNNKFIVQQNFKNDNRFNVFRKFTRTYIENASIEEILPLAKLNSQFLSETEQQKIPHGFFAEINLIYSIKIFENLLARIKVLCIINQIDKFLTDYRNSSSSFSRQSKVEYSYMFITLFKKYLKLIITSQYLKDYSQYKNDTVQIIFEFNNVVHSLSKDKFSVKQIAFYNSLSDILELLNKKNNTSIGEFEQKINLINSILEIIDSDKIANAFISNNIPLPESILLSEILFTTKQLLLNEKDFLVFKLRDNIKNESSESQNNLKKLLNSITKETTNDELRNIKQHIDNFSNEKLQTKFYNKIILPQKILFFYSLQEDSDKHEKELIKFSQDIRKTFFSIDKQNELVIEQKIDNISRKKYNIPTIQDDIFFDILLKTRHNPDFTSLLPESINVEIYEFLINRFIDKYSFNEASKKINEYSIPKYSFLFTFLTSWWFPLLLLIMVGFSLSLLVFDNNKIIETINGFIMLVLTFLPATAIIVTLIFILIKHLFIKLTIKPSKSNQEKATTIYKHLSNFGISKIAHLSYKLLLFEFIIPLSIGIFFSIQDPDLLYGILRIGDFRLITLIPILITLSYYSLFKDISKKNENIDKKSIHKNSIKIYIIILAQAWSITVIVLNTIVKYFYINKDTFKPDWDYINTIGQVINFLGFDFLVFPLGAIIITFISLFIGLFVNSFSKSIGNN